MMYEDAKAYIEAEKKNDKKTMKEILDDWCSDHGIFPGGTTEEFMFCVKIVKRGIVERHDCWDRLDDKAFDLWEEEKFDECYDYCASHIRIWLPEDVEELIKEEKYQEAYDRLCSLYPELTVKRTQENKRTEYDKMITNTEDWLWIKNGKHNLKNYLNNKKTQQNPINEYDYTIGEIGRLYRKNKAGL